MQTYLNTIGGNPVHSEAVALVDSSGNPITTLNVNIGTSTLNATVSGTVNAVQSGDWTVKSPNASNFLTSVSGTVTATQSNASNFLATISGTVTAVQSNASNQLVTASQGGTWNIGTVTTVTNPVAATQSGTWNIGAVTTLPNINITISKGAATLASGQVTMGNVSTTIVGSRPTRRSATIRNQDTANSGFIGPAPIGITNGLLLRPLDSISVDFTGVIAGISATTSNVTFGSLETYD